MKDIKQLKTKLFMPIGNLMKMCANEGCGKIIYSYQVAFRKNKSQWNDIKYCDEQCGSEAKASKISIKRKNIYVHNKRADKFVKRIS